MKPGEIVEVNGKKYMAELSWYRLGCGECAAGKDHDLCRKLPMCIDLKGNNDIVYKEVTQ